jgi:periplasmic divalent cation tolerance protein
MLWWKRHDHAVSGVTTFMATPLPVSDFFGGLVGGLVEIRTTFGSREAAMACAERLVRDRLAACAQVDGPVMSTYVWQGALERAEEWRCTCKTTDATCAMCVAGILAGHDYEIPQVIVLSVEATPAYANWIRSVVAAT